MKLDVGIHYDVDPDVYHSDPTGAIALSASVAHTLVSKSPRHAYLTHPKLGGKSKKPTREMDAGSVGHAILLGRGKQFAVVKNPNVGEINPKTKEPEGEFEDWKRKAAQEARDAVRAEGKVPLLTKHADAAFEMAEQIRNYLRVFHRFEFKGRSEIVVIWREGGVLCRGALDHLIETPSFLDIYDLKIVDSAHPDSCRSHMISYGGHIQAAAYISALETLRPEYAGRVRFTNLFCERDEPHVCTPVRFGGGMAWLGSRRWRRGVRRWKACLEAGKWPGYVVEPVTVEPPVWAMMAEEAEVDEDATEETASPDGPSEPAPSNGGHDEYGPDIGA